MWQIFVFCLGLLDILVSISGLLNNPGLIDEDRYVNSINYIANQQPKDILGNLSDVRYLLWTRSNSETDSFYRLYPGDEENLNNSPFNPKLPTYIKYHGFNDYGMCGWIVNAKTELLKKEDCNVIAVDWEKLVISPFYLEAIQNLYKVAEQTAGLIDWFALNRGLDTMKVHITGHSLGAHNAGLSAKYVTTGTIGRVTGLDPAGPLFYDNDVDHRIDKSDAEFVDIIHTNSGSLLQGCIALYKAYGDVDFYVNGGHHQPNCVPQNDTTGEDWLDLFNGCSHARVTTLWVESIRADPPQDLTFVSWPCESWDKFNAGECPTCGEGCLNMGFYVNQQSTGLYHLRTNAESPYAKGDHQK